MFLQHEVKTFILRMKNNKASGCDGFTTEVWHRLVIKDQGIQILTTLFNMIRNKSVFPKEWKHCTYTTNLQGKGR
jgi:hypothetical protein